MTLKILLPFQVFAQKTGVSRAIVDTPDGSFGFLPHRLDCVTAISAGILSYQTEDEKEAYIAIDEGILVKTGTDIVISVRNAIEGSDLNQLREDVKNQFLNLDEAEKSMRMVMNKMESGLMRRLVEFNHV